jgi:gamma-glutamyltranspeptidase / glutathione hydrolase
MMPSLRFRAGWLAALSACLIAFTATVARADEPAYGVAVPHPLAAEVAHDVLAAGGNAFDAAVAVSAALAVVEPYGSGLGGGGFWLLHDAATARDVMIDGRERAPLAATADHYRDDNGAMDSAAALDGPLAAAIPGEPAALDHIARNYARLPLADLLQPAINLARDGFEVDQRYARLASFRVDVLNEWNEAADIYLDAGEVPAEGYRVRQPDLADTLERLAREGRAGFYEGPVAERMVEAVRAAGGIWSRQDLLDYEVVEREPIVANYHDLRLVSAPPPSSGGIALAQMLAMLEGFDLAAADEAGRIHLVVEAMRRAYHDRARYLGDVDFVDVPVERLTDSRYNAGLAASIRTDRATPSDVFPGPAVPAGGRDTTHFSIIDGEGNRVAATLSLNYPFGSGFMPPATGVVLNNHMDDFAIEPGTANAYGLVQGEANRIEPGKRMLSSMSPTFLEQGERVAAIGTPGASRIINMVLLAALEFHDGGEARDLVEPARYHHQYLPDVIQHEPDAFSDAVRNALTDRGHELEDLGRTWGNSQAVVVEGDGALSAASDPRGVGTSSATGRVGSR